MSNKFPVEIPEGVNNWATKYTFPCGCVVPVIDGNLSIPYEEMLFDLNYGKTSQEVWKVLGEGKTKGVFQLEGFLGRRWSGLLQPESLAEMAVLIAILRPGCLKAISDGKSMSQHFVDRKHRLEEIIPLHPALEPILRETHQLIIFQEDSLRIARDIAGLSEETADVLRSAIGKKQADLMAKMKDVFLDGCKETNIVDNKTAIKLFNWIQESQRYQFNRSHSTSYGAIGYLTGWVKAHLPLHFFCAWLAFAREKQNTQEETRELIDEAKKFNITILPPTLKSILYNESDVCIDGESLRFGLKNMKRVGNKTIDKIRVIIKNLEPKFGHVSTWKWNTVLLYLLPELNSQTVNALITGGVLDTMGLQRSRMLFEYEKVSLLTDKQLSLLAEVDLGLNGLNQIKEKVNKNQKKKIDDIVELLAAPLYQTQDRIPWVIVQEKDLYGVSLTYDPIDQLKNGSTADTTCKEFIAGKEGTVCLCGEIEEFRKFKIKSGKNIGKWMGSFKLNDGSGIADCVVFSSQFGIYVGKIYQGNLVSVTGEKGDSGSLMVRTVEDIF